MLENYPVYYLPGPIPPYSNKTNPSDTLSQIRDQFSIPLTKKFYTLKLIDDENQNLSQIFNHTECSGLIIANISNNFLNTQKVEIQNKTDKYQIHFIDRIGSHEFDLEFKNTDNLNSKILEIIKICNFGNHQLEFILSGTILDAGECIYSIMQRNRCNRPIYVFETTKKLNNDAISVIHEAKDVQEKIEDKSEIPDNGKIHLKLHSLIDGDNHYNIDFDPNTLFDKVIDQLIKYDISLQEIEVGFMDIHHHRIDINDEVDDYNNKDIFFGNVDEMFTNEFNSVDLTSRLAEPAPEPTNTITERCISQQINFTSNDFIPEEPKNKEEKPTEESNSTTTDISAPISDKIDDTNTKNATKESNSTTTDIDAPINNKIDENNKEKAAEVPKGVIRLIDIDNQNEVTEFLIDETTTFETLVNKLYDERFNSAVIEFRDSDWNKIENEDNASKYESSYVYWGLDISDNWKEKPSSNRNDLKVVKTEDLRNLSETQENSIQKDEPVEDSSTTINQPEDKHEEVSTPATIMDSQPEVIETNQPEDKHEEVSTPATIMDSQPEVIEIALQQLGHSEITLKSFHKNAKFDDVTSDLVTIDDNLEQFALTYMTEKGKIIDGEELVRNYISEKIIWEDQEQIQNESDRILAEQTPQKPIESPVTESPASYDSNNMQSPQNELIAAFAEPPSYIQAAFAEPSTESAQAPEDKIISTENTSSDDMIVTIKACRSFSDTNASTPIEIKLPSTSNISDLRNALIQQKPDFGKDYIEFRDREGVKYSDDESIELTTNRGIFVLMPQTVKTVTVTFEGWKTFEVEETPRDKIPNMLKIIGDVNITYDPSLEKIEADESITKCNAKIDNGVIVIANVDGKLVGEVILASNHQFEAIISVLSNSISEIKYPMVYDESGNDINYQTPKDVKLNSPIKVNIGEHYNKQQNSSYNSSSYQSQDFEENIKSLMDLFGENYSEEHIRSILQACDGDIDKAVDNLLN